VLGVEGLDQFRAVEVCVVDEEPHLVVREVLGRHAGVGNRLHLTCVRELAVKPRGMDVLRQHHRRAIVDLGEGPGSARREDRTGAERFTRLRVFPVRHQPRETDTPPIRVADEVWLLRPLDFARRGIDALDRLPLVPAFRGDQAARPAPGVAPHRFPGGFLDACVEARLRGLGLLPPVGHQAPAPGGELEPLRVRRPAQELDRVGGKDVEAAWQQLEVVPAEVPIALDRGFLGADEPAAHG